MGSALESLKKLGIKNQRVTRAKLEGDRLSFSTKSVNLKSPWILEDEDGNESVVIGKNELEKIVKAVAKFQDEKLKLILEKAILQQMPIDFEDVWTVAMREIDKKANSLQEEKDHKMLDIGDIVKDIKKLHPNLFFDLNELMGSSLEY